MRAGPAKRHRPCRRTWRGCGTFWPRWRRCPIASSSRAWPAPSSGTSTTWASSCGTSTTRARPTARSRPRQHDRHVGARPRSPHGSSTFERSKHRRSLTWAGEGARACRLVTNVLYKWNDASLITVLCTAEGFPDMWALLKLTKRFSEKLQQLALPPEYAHAFQAFSILHKLTHTYPATSLSTFKFACTRPTCPLHSHHHRPRARQPPPPPRPWPGPQLTNATAFRFYRTPALGLPPLWHARTSNTRPTPPPRDPRVTMRQSTSPWSAWSSSTPIPPTSTSARHVPNH